MARRIRTHMGWIVGLLSAAPALCEEAELYVPGWNSKSWSDIVGSQIASDDAGPVYTVFCGNPSECNIAGEVPLVFTEDENTLIFQGTITSTYIANLECALKGKTEATCSGYTSCRSGYTAGLCEGPDEMTWTSTFSGEDVFWATVPLTDAVPDATRTLDLSATAGATLVTPVNTNDMVDSFPTDSIFPQETDSSGLVARPRPAVAAGLVFVGMVGCTLWW